MQYHGQSLHTQAQIHYRVWDIVLCQCRGRIYAKCGHFNPAVTVFGAATHKSGMVCKYFYLGIWHVVFAALLIGPEAELLKSELG